MICGVDKASSAQCSTADHSGDGRRTPAVRPEALEAAARLFRAIGDTPRLRLLALLGQGEACVTELALAEHENISTISQRLRVLRSEHLAVGKRRGKHVTYGLADQHVMDLIFNALAHAGEVPVTKNPLDSIIKGEEIERS
jgi:ArsR family transcriptional regulator, lead/cadmium/zinc/bismuth-responsive transcriptional repressor